MTDTTELRYTFIVQLHFFTEEKQHYSFLRKPRTVKISSLDHKAAMLAAVSSLHTDDRNDLTSVVVWWQSFYPTPSRARAWDWWQGSYQPTQMPYNGTYLELAEKFRAVVDMHTAFYVPEDDAYSRSWDACIEAVAWDDMERTLLEILVNSQSVEDLITDWSLAMVENRGVNKMMTEALMDEEDVTFVRIDQTAIQSAAPDADGDEIDLGEELKTALRLNPTA